MLVATMHFLTPSGACKHTTHQSHPLKRSAEWQRDRSDSWEAGWGTCFLSPSTCNTDVYLYLSLLLCTVSCSSFPCPNPNHKAHISTFWKILACKSEGS